MEQQRQSTRREVEFRGEQLLNFLSCESQARRPSWENDTVGGLAGKSCDGNIELVALAPDERIEFLECGPPDATIQNSLPPPIKGSTGAESGRGCRQSSRNRTPTPKIIDLPFHTVSDEFFFDEEFTIIQNAKAEELKWGKSKRRTARWSAYEAKQYVSHLTESEHAEQSRNLPDSGRTEASNDLTQWHTSKKKSSDKRGFRRRSVGRIPRKPNKFISRNNMTTRVESIQRDQVTIQREQVSANLLVATRIESLQRDLASVSRHEPPATPMKTPIRKRKGGVFDADAFELESRTALNNRRAWSDHTSQRSWQEFYQPPSYEEVRANQPRSSVMVPQPSLLEAMISGQFAGGDPRYHTLDAFVQGSLHRPSMQRPATSQICLGELPSPSIYALDSSADDIDARRLHASHLHGPVSFEGLSFEGLARDDFSIGSEPSANVSGSRPDSDDDYVPPGGSFEFESHQTDNAIKNFSRSRRCSILRRGCVPERVTSQSDLFADFQQHRNQQAPATPTNVTNPLSGSAPPAAAAISYHQHASLLNSKVAPPLSASGAHDGAEIRDDIQEHLAPDEPSEGNLFEEDEDEDEEEEEEEEDGEAEQEFFDLNELPEQRQPQKIPARKKHRPKVFREGRPYRVRKARKPEEHTFEQLKASEAGNAGEKPGRGRKKRATPAAFRSTGDESAERGAKRTVPVAANCGSTVGLGGCAEYREKEPDIRWGMRSPPGRLGVYGVTRTPQTPTTGYGLVRTANNTLVFDGTISGTPVLHVRPDGSPLSTTSSVTPDLSRKGEGESGSEGRENRQGARRELFKKPRGKSRGEEGFKIGKNFQLPVDGGVVDPNSASAPNRLDDLLLKPKITRKRRTSLPTKLNARALKVAFLEPASVSPAVTQKRKYTRKSQLVAAFAAEVPLSDMGIRNGSTITSEDPASQSISARISYQIGSPRMRAAARSKFVHPSLSKLRINGPFSGPTSLSQMAAISELDQLTNRMAQLELTDNELQMVPHVIQQSAMVPFMPFKRRKARAKVMLDGEDMRVWKLLMSAGTSYEDGSSEKDASKQWDGEKAIMKERAIGFIAKMRQVQGNRSFTRWGGSLVDSVIGAFLTQNVSDHLSSSAYMGLAARFPAPRKNKGYAKSSEQTTFTEARVEEIFDFSKESSSFQFPIAKGSESLDSTKEARLSAFRVEEGFEISEKSSVIGGGSSESYNQPEALSIKVTDHSCGLEHTIPSSEQSRGSTSPAQMTVELLPELSTSSTGIIENSSCSSKCCSSKSSSCSGNLNSKAVDSLDARGGGQEKPSIIREESLSHHSGLEEVTLDSSVHSLVNSNSRTPFLDSSEQEALKKSVLEIKSSDQEDSQVLSASPFNLYVDLKIAGDRSARDRGLENSTSLGFLTHANNLRTYETAGCAVLQEHNHQISTIYNPVGPLDLGVNCCTDEEVGPTICSPIFSSDSFDTNLACEKQLENVCDVYNIGSVLDTEANCARDKDDASNTAGVMYSSDSFGTNRTFKQQLVVSSAEDSKNADDLLQGDLHHTQENHNLHSLKSLMRRKLKVMKRALSKPSPTSDDVNLKYGSEVMNSSNTNQDNEVQGPKKVSIVGLSGLDRARLEQTQTTSKVAVDWEAVRLKYTEQEINEDQNETMHAGCQSFGSTDVENGVDWDAVRNADVGVIADVIKERGMHNVLAGRIKAFLERVYKEHGSVDLEWLRTVSVEEAKSFLLSVRGLGLKSVECIRLLTLHHLAFPVDTNVGRICVRLGWVPLEPLPEELQLHLLELYPVQETIQKYLWPRLCSLDQKTLYELHYQMITFGKVFCTKSRPNCNACPMRDNCQHFASALASARLAIKAGAHDAHDDAHSTNSERLDLQVAAAKFIQKAKLALPALSQDASPGEKGPTLSTLNSFIQSQKACEPIIEEPSSPEHVIAAVTEIGDIEDYLGRDGGETFIGESSRQSRLNEDASTPEVILPESASTIDIVSRALVVLPPGLDSLPVPKLKNIGRLRTVHYVYELPDHHPLLKEMEDRVPDDPSYYLLAIWSPGESPQAPLVLDDLKTPGTCHGFNNGEEETVKGTILVPCRTAMRGMFPLNGTYFQVNEVFADSASSLQPLEVPRELLWNLRRRFVYFGTSVTTIFRGLSTEEVQACFWEGYVCVRGFDCTDRTPRPLAARLHFAASKFGKKRAGDKNAQFNDED